MTPKVGEVWIRKKFTNSDVKEVRVIAIDDRYIHIEDKNSIFYVYKEIWDEHFQKKERD